MKRSYFKNPVFIIIALLVVGFAVFLGVKIGITIAFAFFSIAIATYFASRSLKLTSDALELQRVPKDLF